MSTCNVLVKEREKIFKGLEFDSETKEIYHPCCTIPLGIVVKGKIVWFSKSSY
jgi:hypothetical protein